ncbi:uncharacterized protein LOC125381888 [Haliotis rufescens]|uniref:uncharacterized protein LOC125381888 n=1 Tax=Haliotis rufescens TaxID=6454 RepID=UPI00201F88AE|nr:uncharacterized protein LOC125381888 [Haliotis rufescens]
MMPLSVSGGNDRSFLQQESRRRRNEAELSELKDGVNGICEEDPICGRCPDTNAALEGEMQPRDCAENSMEKNVKSAPCLQENEVETSQEKPEENEHVETWSCSTYTGMSAYSYKQVTLSNGCPWTVDKS